MCNAFALLNETLKRSGANTEIGLALHRIFQEAGLPAPSMRMEILLGSDPHFTRWIVSFRQICVDRMDYLVVAAWLNSPQKSDELFPRRGFQMQAEFVPSNRMGLCSRW